MITILSPRLHYESGVSDGLSLTSFLGLCRRVPIYPIAYVSSPVSVLSLADQATQHTRLEMDISLVSEIRSVLQCRSVAGRSVVG